MRVTFALTSDVRVETRQRLVLLARGDVRLDVAVTLRLE
jgi:hypothetical protein